MEEFSKLLDNGSIFEYQQKFEELRSAMMQEKPELTEISFSSTFVSSLNEELRLMAKMFKPPIFNYAFKHVLLQEQTEGSIVRCSNSSNTSRAKGPPQ